MIREVGEAVGNAVVSSVGRAFGRAQEQRPLASDLLESDDAYLVVFDAPDVAADDVQVRYEDGTVHVRLDRYREHEADFEMRFPGRGLTLSGRRTLPDDAAVDPDEATAKLRANGTLEVRVPKRDGTQGAEDADEDANDGPEDANDGAQDANDGAQDASDGAEAADESVAEDES